VLLRMMGICLPTVPKAQADTTLRWLSNELVLRANADRSLASGARRERRRRRTGRQPLSVRRTPKRGLRQVDFVFDGNKIRGLEQNPDTRSEWAKLARSGKKVMQFLSGGR